MAKRKIPYQFDPPTIGDCQMTPERALAIKQILIRLWGDQHGVKITGFTERGPDGEVRTYQVPDF